MKKRLILLFLFCMFFGFSGCAEVNRNKPIAKEGKMDLSSWDFSKDGNITLDGEWEFYWKQTNKGIQIDTELGREPKYIYQTIPSNWKGADWFGETLGGFGYATYKLKVLFPKNTPMLAFHNLDLSSAYRLYINGKLVVEQGSFGINPNYFEPSYKSVLMDLEPLSGETEIVYEISNFHYSKGGFWESMEVGERRMLYDKVNRSYQITSFLAGSIFLWALYHLGLFVMRRQDKASLFISLFSLLIVMRLLTIGERNILNIFPNMPMDFLIRLEFATIYIATIVFAYFYRLVFPNTVGKKTMWVLNILITPFLISLFLPVAIFSAQIHFFQIFLILVCVRITIAIIMAYRSDTVGAGLSLIGFSFVFGTVVHDILYQNNIINTMNITPFGFLGFILFQGYILSYGFTRAYLSIEKLKEKLEVSNKELNILKEGLEDIVVERTQELENSKANIERLNEFAKTLNTSLELDSILTKAFHYLNEEVFCDSMILLLVDAENSKLIYHKSVFSPNSGLSLESKLNGMSFSLDSSAGIFYHVYKRNRPFRFAKVWETRLTESNKQFVQMVGKHPGMIIPLSSQGKVIALLALFSEQKGRSFSRSQLQLVENTAENIATAVTNSILVEEMNREKFFAENSRMLMENAKNEVVKLNEFTKKINSESSLSQIIEEMFNYILKTFEIEATLLQLIDTKKNELYTYNTTIPTYATKEQLLFAKSIRVPLNEKGGIIYKTYLRKKALFVPKPPKRYESELDEQIFSQLSLTSFVAVPLVVQNEVIGMAYFTSFQKPLDVTREVLRRISGFCDQIAGAIQNSLLLQITEEERKKSEQAKAEIQKMNEFAKNVNSQNNLENILAEIFGFIRKNYKIEHCVLYFLDKEYNEFRYLNHSGFDLLVDENINYFKSLRFPLREESGFIYKCYKRKRHFYMKHVPKSLPFAIDKQITERSGMNGFLISPLVNNDEVVAMAVYGISDENIQLNTDEVNSIVGVSEHIASAINNHFLLRKIEEEKQRSDSLLLNILPKNVAEELQKKGRVNPVEFENVTLLLTSFPGFSQITGQLTPEELIEGLDLYFSRFDEIIKAQGMEKLRMTGDMYLAAGGLPVGNFTHAVDACLAALQIKDEVMRMIEDFKDIPFRPNGITIAIHSGPVVAGVIGKSKFNYDVWGKTVTQAQAIRRGGVGVPINISQETMEKVKRLFHIGNQRQINTYEGDQVPIYELLSLKPDLSDDTGSIPNEKFGRLYTQQKRGAKILIK
ncbi:adenylate/guanylate cyclase domain-containing protein [Leptospira harrisiae]|uniref:Adenylate cyclase n=1 Tax=Leptospira harrisiae TaxID=2023189 RepID=A0A2N0ALB5_9LEPT|nr:adenylate/guanylate cyclase domain-containing protein [Leptospira harrisiae]PJZ85070.1 adenylate cyclase [Leptospira harrisiae]PKA08575.1 adenylate cyclase [Leptospira harrisiae]